LRSESQWRARGARAPERLREHAASDSLVAAAISRSEKASSIGAVSRLNDASSLWPGCSRAQLRLRRWPSLIASPRVIPRGTAARIVARGLRRSFFFVNVPRGYTTDPLLFSGWYDFALHHGLQGEIGDACAWTDIANDTFRQ
jgi:hypothetical protein